MDGDVRQFENTKLYSERRLRAELSVGLGGHGDALTRKVSAAEVWRKVVCFLINKLRLCVRRWCFCNVSRGTPASRASFRASDNVTGSVKKLAT